ncbi:MAG: BON domain-containing protein [Acidobacteria bacterium]|nr:BON domain-containing protein [Acidobacteriota bacterium]
MKSRMLSRMAMAAVFVAGTAFASAPGDAGIARSVRHEVLTYPYYTLWDDISFQVDNGNVVLEGAVTEPYKKTDLTKLMQRIPGVASVTNDLKVLPLSDFDNRLRWQVARAIFSDPLLSRYAMGANPSIHIIVDNGHVTLTGAVSTQTDKEMAGIRANGAGLAFGPIVNNLSVDQPAKGKRS